MTDIYTEPVEPQFNVHSATDAKHCREMARLNGWQLEKVEPTQDPILEVDCYFKGKQTSFAPRENM